jgi:NAD(P)-dependent dehydrogenase (short-subunit alcohol dehydrogenase family)
LNFTGPFLISKNFIIIYTFSISSFRRVYGKKILIKGAAGGFGFLTVKQLRSEGHNVCATVRDIGGRNQSKASELEKLGAKVIEMDVTDDTSVIKAVDSASKHLNGIDVLINNAGVGVIGLTESFTAEDMKKIFDVNVFGVQRMNRAVLPHMRKNS